jgi:DNA-binding transcriptional ArsR family regulator
VNTYVTSGLQALGDPTRLAVFQLLTRHPHAVNQLASVLPVSRPAVSQHLRVLKQARLVRDRRAGTRRIYEVDPQGVAMLRDHFAAIWDHSLAAFKLFAEAEYKKEQSHDPRSNARNRRKKNPASGSSR